MNPSLTCCQRTTRAAFLGFLQVQPCSMSHPGPSCAGATSSSEDGGAVAGHGLGSSGCGSRLPAWTGDAVHSNVQHARMACELVALPYGRPWEVLRLAPTAAAAAATAMRRWRAFAPAERWSPHGRHVLCRTLPWPIHLCSAQERQSLFRGKKIFVGVPALYLSE